MMGDVNVDTLDVLQETWQKVHQLNAKLEALVATSSLNLNVDSTWLEKELRAVQTETRKSLAELKVKIGVSCLRYLRYPRRVHCVCGSGSADDGCIAVGALQGVSAQCVVL